MKQDGTRQYLKSVSIHETKYALPCEHKKHSKINGQISCFVRVTLTLEVSGTPTPDEVA